MEEKELQRLASQVRRSCLLPSAGNLVVSSLVSPVPLPDSLSIVPSFPPSSSVVAQAGSSGGSGAGTSLANTNSSIRTSSDSSSSNNIGNTTTTTNNNASVFKRLSVESWTDDTSDSPSPSNFHYEHIDGVTGMTLQAGVNEALAAHPKFLNPYTLDKLAALFRINKDASLFREKLLSKYIPIPSGNVHIELRKFQNKGWALDIVASGVQLAKKGKLDEAISAYSKALEVDLECVEGLVARGAAYANQGHYAKAVRDFQAALSVDPSHKNAIKYLEITREKMNQVSAATKQAAASSNSVTTATVPPAPSTSTNTSKLLSTNTEVGDSGSLTLSAKALEYLRKESSRSSKKKKKRRGKEKQSKKKKKRKIEEDSDDSSSSDEYDRSSVSSSSSRSSSPSGGSDGSAYGPSKRDCGRSDRRKKKEQKKSKSKRKSRSKRSRSSSRSRSRSPLSHSHSRSRSHTKTHHHKYNSHPYEHSHSHLHSHSHSMATSASKLDLNGNVIDPSQQLPSVGPVSPISTMTLSREEKGGASTSRTLPYQNYYDGGNSTESD